MRRPPVEEEAPAEPEAANPPAEELAEDRRSRMLPLQHMLPFRRTARSRSLSSGEIPDFETCEDGGAASERGRSSSRSLSESSFQSCSSVEEEMAVERPFPGHKEKPMVLFYGPGFRLVAKPAGWDAGTHGPMHDSSADGEAVDPKEKEVRLLTSGHVEYIGAHPAGQGLPWRTFLSPGPFCSGLAILAEKDCDARKHLEWHLVTQRMFAFSVALIPGAPEPGQTVAAAHKSDGALQASVMGVYCRRSSDWSMETESHYTLILLKATGKAIGQERSLLKICWGAPAVGDTEMGDRTDWWPQGRPFVHCLALWLATAWWTEDLEPTAVAYPLPRELLAALSQMQAYEEPGTAFEQQAPGPDAAAGAAVHGDADAAAGPGCAAGSASAAASGEPPEVSSTTEFSKELLKALCGTGLPPPDFMHSLGLGCGPAAALIANWAPKKVQIMPPPAPFGEERWTGQVCTRREWVFEYVWQVLERAEDYELEINDGWIRVKDITWRFPVILEASFRNFSYILDTVKKDGARHADVGGTIQHPTLRRRPAAQSLQIFVEDYCSRLPPGEIVTLEDLLVNGYVKRILCRKDLPQKPLLTILRDCGLFTVGPEAKYLELNPLPVRLCKGVEELLCKPDVGIHRKLLTGRGSVPLAWLLTSYAYLLCGRNKPPSPLAAAVMLKGSEVVEVDPSTFLVRRVYKELEERGLAAPPVPPLALLGDAMVSATRRHAFHKRQRGGSDVKESNRQNAVNGWKIRKRSFRSLAELLDFYFEPFNLQHTRGLLHSANEDGWEWPLYRIERAMKRVRLQVEGLPASVKEEMLRKAFQAFPPQFCKLSDRSSPKEGAIITLTYPPDFRLPVLRDGAPNWLKSHFLEYPQERFLDTIPDPASMAVLSYCLGSEEGVESILDYMASVAEKGESGSKSMTRDRWHRKILRQVRAYETDIICLQRCEANLGGPLCSVGILCPGRMQKGNLVEEVAPTICPLTAVDEHNYHPDLFTAIVSFLEPEDYEWIAIPSYYQRGLGALTPCATLVMWQRRRWSCAKWWGSESGALSVTLRPRDSPEWSLGVCSLAPPDLNAIVADLTFAKEHAKTPAVICGNFISQHEVKKVMKEQGLHGVRNAMKEVLGEELKWTQLPPSLTMGNQALECSDGIWLRGSARVCLEPLAAVSGHSMGPMRTSTGAISRHTFPTDHIPLVVALQRRTPVNLVPGWRGNFQ